MDSRELRNRVLRSRERDLGGFRVLRELSKTAPEFTRERAHGFLTAIEAVPTTYELYSNTATFRAWEALALFHHLNPAALGLNHRGRLSYIEKMLDAADSAHPVWAGLFQYTMDLKVLRRDIVSDRALKHRMGSGLDPIHVPVSSSWFENWVRQGPHSPRSRPEEAHADSVTAIDPPARLRALIAVNNEIYCPIRRGGTFDPSNPGPLERTRQALLAAGVGSINRARVGATYLSRPGQGPGKKSKKAAQKKAGRKRSRSTAQ